jgi:hypothetical protein
MDFLTTYQKRALRFFHSGLVAFRFGGQPQRVVVDMRGGVHVPSDIRSQLVSVISSHTSISLVVQVDSQSDLDQCLSLIRFAHRLDCMILIRAFDCFVFVPLEQIDAYVYRKVEVGKLTVPPWLKHFSGFRVELTYNRHIGMNVQKIWSTECGQDQVVALVLPERSDELPKGDAGWRSWKRDEHPNKKNMLQFEEELRLLRNEVEQDMVGYRSSKICQIDRVQILLSEKGSHACPHKEIGEGHVSAIRACTRSCLSMELRTPSKRGTLASLQNVILRRRE